MIMLYRPCDARQAQRCQPHGPFATTCETCIAGQGHAWAIIYVVANTSSDKFKKTRRMR